MMVPTVLVTLCINYLFRLWQPTGNCRRVANEITKCNAGVKTLPRATREKSRPTKYSQWIVGQRLVKSSSSLRLCKIKTVRDSSATSE